MIKRLTLFALLAVLGMTRLSAQVDFTDITLSSLEDEQSVDLSMGINYFRLTADRDAVLQFSVGFGGILLYYTDAEGTVDSDQEQLSSTTTSTGYVYNTSVVAGETYYFRTSRIVEATTITISYESSGQTSVQISVSANYSDGDTYVTTGSNLELTFDRRVTVDRTLLVYGEGDDDYTEISSDYINTSFFINYYYSISLASVVNSLVSEGQMSEGDVFTVRLEGIADASDASVIYGDDGIYTISFVLGAQPAYLVSVDPEDGSSIPNYYPADGSGQQFTFVFSDELDPEASVRVTVSYGDTEAGSYSTANATYTIDGNTLVVDLSDTKFPETVETSRSGTVSTTVTMSIYGLTTLDGSAVESNYASSGSTAVVVTYTVEKQSISFYYDFDPYNGVASLDGYTYITVWVSTPIYYSGIRLDWTDARGGEQSRTYTADEVPFSWDDDLSGYVAQVPISSIGFGTRPLTLTVLDAVIGNGDEVEITGTFNTNATTAIESVNAAEADTEATLYSPAGVMVRQGSRSTILNDVRPGLYILNGEKVVVK